MEGTLSFHRLITDFENDKNKIAKKFFEMIFNACPKKSKTLKLKMEKRMFSGKHILQRSYHKKKLTNYVAIELIIQKQKAVSHQIFRISYRMLHLILEKHTLI